MIDYLENVIRYFGSRQGVFFAAENTNSIPACNATAFMARFCNVTVNGKRLLAIINNPKNGWGMLDIEAFRYFLIKWAAMYNIVPVSDLLPFLSDAYESGYDDTETGTAEMYFNDGSKYLENQDTRAITITNGGK